MSSREFVVLARVPEQPSLWLIQLRRNVQEAAGLEPKDIPRLGSSGFGFALLPPGDYDPEMLDAAVATAAKGQTPPQLSLADIKSSGEANIYASVCGDLDSLDVLSYTINKGIGREFEVQPQVGIFRGCDASLFPRLVESTHKAVRDMEPPAPFVLSEVHIFERTDWRMGWQPWKQYQLSGELADTQTIAA